MIVRCFPSLGLSLLLVGCTSLAIGAADPASLQSGSMIESCPLGVSWTRMQLHEVGTTSFRIDFVTRAATVEELRGRVRDQALVRGPGQHRGHGHWGQHNGAKDHGLQLWQLGATVQTRVEDIPGGAALWVDVGSDPVIREEARANLAARTKLIASRSCP